MGITNHRRSWSLFEVHTYAVTARDNEPHKRLRILRCCGAWKNCCSCDTHDGSQPWLQELMKSCFQGGDKEAKRVCVYEGSRRKGQDQVKRKMLRRLTVWQGNSSSITKTGWLGHESSGPICEVRGEGTKSVAATSLLAVWLQPLPCVLSQPRGVKWPVMPLVDRFMWGEKKKKTTLNFLICIE